MIVHVGELGFDTEWEDLTRSDPFCPPFFSKLGVELEIECNRPRCERCEDLSFVIVSSGLPLLGMRIAALDFADAPCELSAYGQYATLTQNRSATIPTEAFAELKRELSFIFARFPGHVFKFREQLLDGVLSPIGHRLLAAGAEVHPRFLRVLDLLQSVATLYASRRRSYKNLITRAEKDIAIELMTARNADADVFEQCRQLHAIAAGRETRTRTSWNLQLERIRFGEAYAALGRIDGELVSFGYFAHTQATALYYSSASRRDLFNRPIFHALLWHAILHSKEIGCRSFEIGGMKFTATGGTSKEIQIALFKSGFGGVTRAQCDFTYHVPQPEEDHRNSPSLPLS